MIEENLLYTLKTTLNQLSPIPDEQFNIFVPLISKAFYKKHEYFVKAGDWQTHVGFVTDGLFRLYYVDMNGKEFTKNFFTQNRLVVAYGAMLRGEPSNLYIQALKNTEVLLIDYHKWMEFMDTHPCWQRLFLKITEYAYLEKERRESNLLFYDAENRYLNFMEEFPGLHKQIKQHHIASFLGMSPETLSRIKNVNLDIYQ